MDVFSQRLNEVAKNPWFVVVTNISTLIAFIWLVYDKTQTSSTIFPVVFFTISSIFLLISYFYSIMVRQENIALQDISETFYEINQIYRDKLQSVFAENAPVDNPGDLIAEERKALIGVCQRVESIFNRIIDRNCMVTIKLIVRNGESHYAQTYVRSQEMCLRDQEERLEFVLLNGENTALDAALKKSNGRKPSHFYSPDLEKEPNYSNQRPDFRRFYRSALVVPIRAISNRDAANDKYESIGFLCLDTLSVRRLNNGFHLFMLAALASQMYNFISLMRGKYRVRVG